ncbi:MAG: cyclodeaminase/cyclohydrolase family protein [Caldilineaceae bacterium]|nr:cyclodeaminase/cyclohydrolase family protein [Caldilineaceae bacterium]
MTTTSEMTIGAFSDALAAKQSTPGGGGAAAITGSLGAALISMVINFTLGRKKYAAVEADMNAYLARSEQLRATLLKLADRDVEAFGAVSACYTMPTATDEEKSARTAAMQRALKGPRRRLSRSPKRAWPSCNWPDLLQRRATPTWSAMSRRPTPDRCRASGRTCQRSISI